MFKIGQAVLVRFGGCVGMGEARPSWRPGVIEAVETHGLDGRPWSAPLYHVRVAKKLTRRHSHELKAAIVGAQR